jgi:hypothetical protein
MLSLPMRALLAATCTVALALPADGAADDAAPKPNPKPNVQGHAGARTAGCLPERNGYVRARIHGALDVEINWRDAELECEGDARPDGSGIRVIFAGPLRPDGRRMRLVFGVTSAGEGAEGHALPTNLTVIIEGRSALFATRGDDKCTVDRLRQERIRNGSDTGRAYRVVARGFCVGPASALAGNERILVSRFDFAGRVVFTSGSPGESSRRAAAAAPDVR